MRKLVLILMAMIAVATFIRSYSSPVTVSSEEVQRSSVGGSPDR